MKQHRSESRIICQNDTITLRQVTDHPSIHHHPFFFVDAWDAVNAFSAA